VVGLDVAGWRTGSSTHVRVRVHKPRTCHTLEVLGSFAILTKEASLTCRNTRADRLPLDHADDGNMSLSVPLLSLGASLCVV